jgi:NAD(P)-dependent dehydrogenase (short-subunit alcohol dehydrogenase family)
MKKWDWSVSQAIVTGAASGIGLELVRALTQAGAQVWAVDRNAEQLGALASTRVHTFTMDVTDENAWTELAASVPDDRPTALFCNAGMGLAGGFDHTTMDDWKRVLDVNVVGVVLGIRAFVPRMKSARTGRIVLTGSGAGLFPRPGMVAYAASKHAVVGLGRSLRAELAAFDVGVSTACPGYIATSIMKNTEWRGVDGAALQNAIPLPPLSAERCAAQMIRGSEKNRAVVIVGRELVAESLLWRFAPGLGDRVAQIRAKAFAGHSVDD